MPAFDLIARDRLRAGKLRGPCRLVRGLSLSKLSSVASRRSALTRGARPALFTSGVQRAAAVTQRDFRDETAAVVALRKIEPARRGRPVSPDVT